MRIAVDAMGGDHAPAAAVEGAVKAHRELGEQVVLVGRASEVRPVLDRVAPGSGIEIIDAPEVIEMHDEPAAAVRRKKGASLVVCAELVKSGEADGLFSAGNTGAMTAVGTLILGRIDGIDRAAIPVLLPNSRGRHTVLLDAGANKDVLPHWLVQFAIMGTIYAHELLGVPDPNVGLMNIGEEETKGNKLAREAFPLLKDAPIRFVGNVEGPDLFNGRADVVVCDGFTGNVILKVAEGVAELFFHLIKEEIGSRPMLKLPAALLKPAFSSLKQRTDYGERGGAPLLGVKGVCVIGHGRSNATAVANAIRTAGEAVRHGIIDKIHDRVAQ